MFVEYMKLFKTLEQSLRCKSQWLAAARSIAGTGEGRCRCRKNPEDKRFHEDTCRAGDIEKPVLPATDAGHRRRSSLLPLACAAAYVPSCPAYERCASSRVHHVAIAPS